MEDDGDEDRGSFVDMLTPIRHVDPLTGKIIGPDELLSDDAAAADGGGSGNEPPRSGTWLASVIDSKRAARASADAGPPTPARAAAADDAGADELIEISEVIPVTDISSILDGAAPAAPAAAARDDAEAPDASAEYAAPQSLSDTSPKLRLASADPDGVANGGALARPVVPRLPLPREVPLPPRQPTPRSRIDLFAEAEETDEPTIRFPAQRPLAHVLVPAEDEPEPTAPGETELTVPAMPRGGVLPSKAETAVVPEAPAKDAELPRQVIRVSAEPAPAPPLPPSLGAALPAPPSLLDAARAANRRRRTRLLVGGGLILALVAGVVAVFLARGGLRQSSIRRTAAAARSPVSAPAAPRALERSRDAVAAAAAPGGADAAPSSVREPADAAAPPPEPDQGLPVDARSVADEGRDAARPASADARPRRRRRPRKRPVQQQTIDPFAE